VLTQPNGTSRRLLGTLDALHWNDGSAKAAGRSMGIHVKTVHNRLRRVEELTGLCLDHPPDRLGLDVALYLLRAHEAGLSACA
jgi:DNA-binding PucR family transcriptional regulator